MGTKQAFRISKTLEELVLTGGYKQGARLDEARLAKRFGVSRTPVREALHMLVASGLAQQKPRRGVFVQQPDTVALAEMYETMAELEAVCSRLSTNRLTPAALMKLKDVNDLCRAALQAGDVDRYTAHNETFHFLIYHAAGNDFLMCQTHRLYMLLKPYRRIQFRVPGRMSQSVSEHDALIGALEAGSKSTAEECARLHVGSQSARLFDQLAQLKHSTPVNYC